MAVRLWLDDKRPAPEGWLHAKTAREAIKVLAEQEVSLASLDHDLGHCEDCTTCNGYKSNCGCECHWTGYTVVVWMAASGHWPRFKPTVHSANPVGADNMRAMIDRHFGKTIQVRTKGEFRLSWKEQAAAEEFEHRHRVRCGESAPKDSYGVAHVGISYRFTETGIGTAVSVACGVCKRKRKITEYEAW